MIVIALGAWELTAFSTGRIPTVSTVFSRWHKSRPLLATTVLVLYLASAGRHLLNG